jgi:hypothetical protein
MTFRRYNVRQVILNARTPRNAANINSATSTNSVANHPVKYAVEKISAWSRPAAAAAMIALDVCLA